MQIDLIHKSQIVDFALKAGSEFENEIPITLERAISQAKNPHAQDEDVLLIIAREKNQLLSFIGAYPSLIQNDRNKRIYYVSCWWKAKGIESAVSHAVLEKFLSIYGKEIALPHLPFHIIKILKKHNIEIYEREGLMIRFRTALHKRTLIRSRKGKYNKGIRLLRNLGMFSGFDTLANLFSPAGMISANNTTHSDFEIFFEIPGEDYFVFCKNFKQYLSIPDKDYLDWIIANPWLVNEKDADRETLKRYDFSYLANDIHYFFPVLKNKNKIVGCGFFSSRDGAVKSLFIFITPGYESQFFSELTCFIQGQSKYHTLISYDRNYVEFLIKNKRKRMKAESIKRYSGTANPEYKELIPADGDGDSCFT